MTRSPPRSGSSSSRGNVGRDTQVGRIVCAATGVGQERALEVEPERLGAVGRRIGQPVADARRESP